MSAPRFSRYIAGGILACFLAFAALSSALGAEPVEPPELKKTFGPDGTAGSNFELAGPSAVDEVTHGVYVLDPKAGKLYKFAEDGTPVDFEGSEPYVSGNELFGLSFHKAAWESQIAVDSARHVILVNSGNAVRAFEEDGEPAEFTAGPGLGTSEISGFTELLGVAVDSNGNIYASDYGGVVKIYGPSGEFITEFATETPSVLTVAPNGLIYLVKYGGQLLKFVPSEYPVTPITTYAFESEPLGGGVRALALSVDLASENLYVVEEEVFGGSTRASEYDPAGSLIVSFGGSGEEGDLKGADNGIAVNSTTKDIYVSTTESGGGIFSKVEIFGPEPIVEGPPAVLSTSAAGLTSSEVTLRGVVNPNTSETIYSFEYGSNDCGLPSATCAIVPAAPASIGTGHKPVAVSQSVSGLQPNTTYHYRIVARNAFGGTKGPDRTFTTQVGDLVFKLPDGRAWEMVSPPSKAGGTLVASSKGIIQAAVNGEGLAYQSLNSIEPDPSGNRAIEASAVLAHRASDGWHSMDISPPRTRASNVANSSEFNLFSPELSKALLEPRDATPLSEASSERAPHLRTNTSPPTYTPLVTSKEGFANVPPATVFGGGEPEAAVSRVNVGGANPALTHVVLESEVPLATGADPFSMYQWFGGALHPVSALPDDEGGSVVQGTLGSSLVSVRNAVSQDGSRVFWGRGNVGTSGINMSAIFVRDTVAEETVRLDVVAPGVTGSGPAVPVFQGASADGGVVFFTDSQALTENASTNGRDLYRCEIDEAIAGCSSLTDISPPIDNLLESANVQGVVSAISDDGTRVYFVAEGKLEEGSNEHGEIAAAGEPNLYLWDESGGLRFITTLSEEDDRDWGRVEGSTPGYVQNLSATASESGRYLAFMSSRNLTGVDDPVSGDPVEQVFGYDAEMDRLVCVSCNPTGAEARGEPSPPPAVDLQGVWGDRLVAGMLPEMLLSGGPQIQPHPLHAPRTVLDNGRIFFQAVDSLVPADSNGTWDVYQYEPTGTGDCTALGKGAATARSGSACVSLISAGTTEGVSTFLDASVRGDDVFFLTKGRLSLEDTDEVNDVYDARVDGIAAVIQPRVECSGESCQSSLPAPDDASVGSEGFHGRGNLHQKPKKGCHKGKRKVRRGGKVHCVRRNHHHKKKSAGERAGGKRREQR
jgi:hypothetical protein